MHQPELLLLDEPTSGLDPLVQETFHELVHEAVAEGRTVFLSSHVLDEVDHLCHTVAIIRDGRIVAVEDVADLRARAGRKVTIRFADPVDPATFAALDGVSDLVVADRTVSMRVSGDLDRLVKAAAAHHVVDLVSTPPDLEEIFLAYYQPDNAVTAAITDSPRRQLARCAPSRWPILERSLRDRRRSLTSWGLGIGVYVALIVAFWPSIRGSSEITKAIENYPDAMKEFFGGAAAFDYTRPGGFLNTQLFSLILPLLIAIFAIGYGASALAGEQQHAARSTSSSRCRCSDPASSARRRPRCAAGVAALTLLSGTGDPRGRRTRRPRHRNDRRRRRLHRRRARRPDPRPARPHRRRRHRATAPSRLGVSTAAFVAGYLIQALSGLVDAINRSAAVRRSTTPTAPSPSTPGFPSGIDLLLVAVCAALAVAARPALRPPRRRVVTHHRARC